MTSRYRALLVVYLLALSSAGCGCSATWDPGSSRRDADVIVGEPVWDPPIEGLGEPGWRESTDPYVDCDGWHIQSWSVWSDSRGVFAYVEKTNPGSGMWPTDDPDLTPMRYGIAFNDGLGWRLLFDDYTGDFCYEPKLTGVPEAQLIMHTRDAYSCPWEEGEEAGIPLELFDSDVVHVVDRTLAFALRSGGLLAFWDGESWGPYPPDPLPYPVWQLWADRSSIFVAGDDGLIMSEDGGGWRIHDTGTLDSIMTLWGFSGDDVWAGTHMGQLLHWNGDVWENVEWPDSGVSSDTDVCGHRGEGILGMWGIEGVLFFHTSSQLVMWDGVDFRVLGYWPGEDVITEEGWHGCEYRMFIRSIWGNSPEEVFLAVARVDFEEGSCGPEFLLWWDGSEFHWF